MKLKYYLRGLGLGIIVTAVVLTIAGGDKESLSDEEIKRRAAQLGMVESSSLTLADVQKNTQEVDNATEAEKPSSEEKELLEDTTGTDVSKEETAASTGANKVTEDATASTEVTTPSEETTSSKETNSPSEEVTPSKEANTPSEETNPSKEANTPSEEVNLSTDENSSGSSNMEVKQDPQPGDVIKITVQAGESSYTVSKQLEELGLIEDALSFDKYLCDIGYSRVIHTGTHRITLGTSEEEIAKIITGKR